MKKLKLSPFASALLGLAAPGVALAGPTGGTVVSGDIHITNPDAVTTIIDQATHSGIVNWQTFSIASDEYVRFNLPSVSAAILNRVLGGSPSEILGQLSSNGRVFLVNPGGVLFGAGAQVDVGGLVASTLDIGNQDFLDGRYVFAGTGNGAVVNDGNIHVADGGFVVLTAAQVANSGLIQARLGDVVLAGGSGLTLDLDGSGLIRYEVTQATLSSVAGITNTGEILADGGRIAMTANVARQLAGTVVNNQGFVRAAGITEDGGEIFLSGIGGDVVQDGTLDVSASAGHDAGTARITSDRDVTLTAGSTVLATGDSGGDVRAIAEGLLTYEAGASIDVARTSADGDGGTAELSGHGRVSIHDIVSLGDHGHLLIDPAGDLIVGGPNDDLDVAVLERQLQTGSSTSLVDVIGASSVFFRNVGDGTIDGRTASAATGAGLRIGVGTVDGSYSRGQTGNVVFEDPTDAIAVDGALSIFGGLLAGTIDVGNLTAGGGILLDAAGPIGARNLTSAGAIRVEQGDPGVTGNIVVGDLDGATVNFFTANGTIQTGAIRSDAAVILQSGNSDVSDDLHGGPVSGINVLGAIAAAGTVNLLTTTNGDGGLGAGISTQDISGGGIVRLAADRGAITTQDITVNAVTGVVTSFNAVADDGAVSTQGIRLTGGANGTVAQLTGNGVNVQGDLVVRSGGGSLGQQALSINTINLAGGAGGVNVTGDIDVAVAGTTVQSNNGTSVNGSVSVSASGAGDVQLQGDVKVSGVGNVAMIASSSGGNVTIGGTTSVTATAARRDTAFDGDSAVATVRREGAAVLQLQANAASNGDGTPGTLSTGNIAVTGPNASLQATGALLRIGQGGTNGPVLSVTATPGGLTTGAFFSRTPGGGATSQSTYGQARMSLQSSGLVAPDQTSVIVNGDMTVTGPSALAFITGPNGVTLGGDIDVTGTGYDISGTFAGLPLPSTDSTAPLLDQGVLRWGDASLLISGLRGGQPLATGNISARDITVTGIGSSDLDIDAANAGVQAVNVVATAGQVRGSYTESTQIDGQTFLATHAIDNGTATGSANAGDASFELTFTRDSANLGSVNVSGLSAQASLQGAGDITVGGTVTVAGAASAATTRVREVTTYARSNPDAPAPPVSSTTTIASGTTTGLAVGLPDGQSPVVPASFTSGDITVSGAGISALSLVAQAVDVGDVTLTANAGSFQSDDFVQVGPNTPVDTLLGNVVAQIGSPAGVANVDSLSIAGAGDGYLGLNVASSGAVDIDLGGGVQSRVPGVLVDLYSPVANAIGVHSGASAFGGNPDLGLQGFTIAGTGVSIAVGGSSSIDDDVRITTSGALVLAGNGGGFTVDGGEGALDLEGLTVAVSGVQIAAGSAEVTTIGTTRPSSGNAINFLDAGLDVEDSIVLDTDSGPIGLTNTVFQANSIAVASALDTTVSDSSLDGDLVLTSGGDVTLSGAALSGGTGTLTAAGDISITGTPFILYDESFTARSTGGAVTVADSNIGIQGTRAAIGGDITLDAAGGDLTFTGAALQGSDVTLTGNNVAFTDTSVSAGNLVIIARAGSVTDAGEDGLFVQADSLGVQASQNIGLDDGQLGVGTGTTIIGGDAALLQALRDLGRNVPRATAANASFIAPAIALRNLNLGGDYLFLQSDDVTLNNFFSPADLFLQYVPTSLDASIGFENLPHARQDVNFSRNDIPSLGQNTIVFGSSSFQGDIVVGDNGPVLPPDNVDVVLITGGGTIFRPSRVQTLTGTVTPIGRVFEDPPPEPDPCAGSDAGLDCSGVLDDIGAVISDPVPGGQPNLPTLGGFLTEDELIEHQTSTPGSDLVCQ